MKYILDSDILTYLYNSGFDEHAAVKSRFIKLTQEDIKQISDITLFELEYSCYNANLDKQQEIRTTINDIKKRFQIVPLSSHLASIYGEIKAKLRKSRGTSTKAMKKHNIDLIVASTAIYESSILVANDDIYEALAEINPKFRYENWTL